MVTRGGLNAINGVIEVASRTLMQDRDAPRGVVIDDISSKQVMKL